MNKDEVTMWCFDCVEPFQYSAEDYKNKKHRIHSKCGGHRTTKLYLVAPLEEKASWEDIKTSWLKLRSELVDVANILERMSEIAAEENKYPHGIISFQNSMLFPEWVDSFGGKIGYTTYGDWVREHLSVNRPIIKVMNSSDEVLSVGSKTTHGEIKSFAIFNNRIMVDNDERFDILRHIDDVHLKEKAAENKNTFSQHLADKLRSLNLGEVEEKTLSDNSGKYVDIRIGDTSLSFSFDMDGEKLI